MLFGLLGTAFQFWRVGLLVPLASPIVPTDALGSFLSTFIAGYGPNFGNSFPKTVAMRQYFHAIWQFFPHHRAPAAGSPHGGRSRRMKRNENFTPSPRYIRCIYRSLALVSRLTLVHTQHSLPEGVSRISRLLQESPQLPATSFGDGVATFLKYDATIAMIIGLVWLPGDDIQFRGGR
ncbi:hypothetical protein ABOM_003382 [Aspergillus bombycis]|uniref:Uncharacterized protein n=1 Tax=Aspergillus bombycis TaxID=109264 RepID=A0A1F8A9F0_9EURO|nr:hypothetical protein ABOM_003382 [Aspergillus bombycis]OGM48356.1 hypothetical protein ABOM_003382 [Aspergillus bombycis]